MVQVSKSIYSFSRMTFEDYFRKFEVLQSFYRKLGEIYVFFLKTQERILTTTSSVFIISDYVITIWYSHLHVLISELIQSKSALFSAENPMFGSWKISSEQRWLITYSF